MSRTLIDECKDGNIKEVYKMIDDGADVNITTNYGVTPLHIASQNSHLEIVRVLIAPGGSVNKANKYVVTPLHVASKEGHLEIVKVLIASGGLVNEANKYGDHLYLLSVIMVT